MISGELDYWQAQIEAARRGIEAADAQEAHGAAILRAAQVARADATLRLEIAEQAARRLDPATGTADEIPWEESVPAPMGGAETTDQDPPSPEATARQAGDTEARSNAASVGHRVGKRVVSGAGGGGGDRGGAGGRRDGRLRAPAGPVGPDSLLMPVAEAWAESRQGTTSSSTIKATLARMRRVARAFPTATARALQRDWVYEWAEGLETGPATRNALRAAASMMVRFAGCPWPEVRGPFRRRVQDDGSEESGECGASRSQQEAEAVAGDGEMGEGAVEAPDGGGAGAAGDPEGGEPVASEVPQPHRNGASCEGGLRADRAEPGRGGDGRVPPRQHGDVGVRADADDAVLSHRPTGTSAIPGADDAGLSAKVVHDVTQASARVFGCPKDAAVRGTAQRRCLAWALSTRGWSDVQIAALLGMATTAIPRLVADARELRRGDVYHGTKCEQLRAELKRVLR